MENACLYKVLLSTASNKVLAPSLLLSTRRPSSHSPNSPQNEIEIDLLHEGALRAFPSNIPTLFNYIEWVV
jgi:hypothetical protein